MRPEGVASHVLSVAVAGVFLAVGLRGLIGKRPLVYSARWFVGVLGVMFMQQLTPLLGNGYSAQLRHAELWSRLVTVALFILLVACWFSLRGYLILGVTDRSLRSALRHALAEHGLPHQNRPGALHLPSEQLDLRLQLNEAAGTAYVKVAPSRGRPLLRQLSRELERFFASHPVELKTNAFVVYACVGVVLLGGTLLRTLLQLPVGLQLVIP